MYIRVLLLILYEVCTCLGQPGKCDQTPPNTKQLTPTESKNMPYYLGIITKGTDRKFVPDQTYVLILESKNTTRPFHEFMITAEDPDVDNSIFNFEHKKVDVGSLKTLDDAKSRYSERCYSSVENTDSSDKYRIEIHWVSPKQSVNEQKIRFRAMVAENPEVWYTGENLTIILEKDDAVPIDSPPVSPNPNCKLCSEARYEMIFKGRWSRGSHPLNYPSKPDDNGYSHVIGASHDYHYTLWKQGIKASLGLRALVESENVDLLEREIIDKMATDSGTRTLIRGRSRRHPHMSEPTEATFRVDRIHHMFSFVVAMKPSPDWFLGTSRFELCTEEGWLRYAEIPLYPWDGGTVDGVSYDSPKSTTQPEDNVERVAVGSFNKDSPFYQKNLNDLKPFALLEVKRLAVYPQADGDCSDEGNAKKENGNEDMSIREDTQVSPLVAESRQKDCVSEWSEWSPCEADGCGPGLQRRERDFLRQGYQTYQLICELKEADTVDSVLINHQSDNRMTYMAAVVPIFAISQISW